MFAVYTSRKEQLNLKSVSHIPISLFDMVELASFGIYNIHSSLSTVHCAAIL